MCVWDHSVATITHVSLILTNVQVRMKHPFFWLHNKQANNAFISIIPFRSHSFDIHMSIRPLLFSTLFNHVAHRFCIRILLPNPIDHSTKTVFVFYSLFQYITQHHFFTVYFENMHKYTRINIRKRKKTVPVPDALIFNESKNLCVCVWERRAICPWVMTSSHKWLFR